MKLAKRVVALTVAGLVFAAPIAGCGGENKELEAAKSSCRVLAFAMAGIDASTAANSMKVCDDVTLRNADQTLADMQQECVRLASRQSRTDDKDIPNEYTVADRRAALGKCNAAIDLVRAGS